MTLSNAVKVTDFRGQSIYVGLDTHFKSWTVSIYSDEFELKTFSQPPDVNLLARFLRTHYPCADFQVAYEAGFSGFWIQRAFGAMGIPCQVIHPADIPGSHKEKIRKTDQVDSRKIAKGLKNKSLNPVFIPDEQQESDRLLIRSRSSVVKNLTMVKNRIKALLKFKGVSIPPSFAAGGWSKGLIAWLKAVPFNETSSQIALQVYVQEVVFLMEQLKQIAASIKAMAALPRYQNSVRLLCSVPSIGLLSAMTLLTEIGQISRFKNIDHLSSYCGLTPNCYSSGETERVTGMSRRGNSTLKAILIECSWMAIRKDPALLLYYKQLLPRMNGNKAIVKVARKLLSRIAFVLRERKEYVTGLIA